MRTSDTPQDHVLILGQGHLRKTLAEFTCHYSDHRPYPKPLAGASVRPGRAVDITARIERRRVMGGLISEYRRAA